MRKADANEYHALSILKILSGIIFFLGILSGVLILAMGAYDTFIGIIVILNSLALWAVLRVFGSIVEYLYDIRELLISIKNNFSESFFGE